MTDDNTTPPRDDREHPRRPEVPAFRELRDLEEPPPSDPPADDTSRKPTIEQERPVDLYHRDRHLREELYGGADADWFRAGDAQPPAAPPPAGDENWYGDSPATNPADPGGVPPLVPRPHFDAPFRIDVDNDPPPDEPHGDTTAQLRAAPADPRPRRHGAYPDGWTAAGDPRVPGGQFAPEPGDPTVGGVLPNPPHPGDVHDTPGTEHGLRGPDSVGEDTAEQPRVDDAGPAHHARPGRLFGAPADAEERGRGWRRRSRTGDPAATDKPEPAEQPAEDAPASTGAEVAVIPRSAGGGEGRAGGSGRGGDGGGGGDGGDDGGGGDVDEPDGFGELPEDPNTPEPSGRSRLANALWPPRVSRAQLVVGVLLFALGAGLAIQVRSNTESDPLRGARESDLVRVLDELEQRTERLDDEQRRLELSRDQLENSNNQAEEARQQTDQRAQVLGILAGTVKATGPGITLTITDPTNQVRADMLLDTLQELRAAGAEAIQINQVRVVAETYFYEPVLGQMQIDGQTVAQPYVFKVIGNPRDLEPALNIPGGVIRTLEKKQAQAVVVPSQQVVVDALRVPTAPDYAHPAPDAGNGG